MTYKRTNGVKGKFRTKGTRIKDDLGNSKEQYKKMTEPDSQHAK